MVLRVDEGQAPRKDSLMGLAELSNISVHRDRNARRALGVALIEGCSQLLGGITPILPAQIPLKELLKKYREFQSTLDSTDWANLRVLNQRHEAYSKPFELRGSFADRNPQELTSLLELGFGSEFFRALSTLGQSLCPQHPIPALLCFQILEHDRNPPFFGEQPFTSPVLSQELMRATAELSWAARRVFQTNELLQAKAASDHIFQTLQYEKKAIPEFPRIPGTSGMGEFIPSFVRRPAS